VVYRGEEMPASRFEVLAGKPDAKKWKTSLNFVGSDGGPAEVSGGPRGGAGAQRGGICQPPCTPAVAFSRRLAFPKTFGKTAASMLPTPTLLSGRACPCPLPLAPISCCCRR
jgi:hypothetical protein